MTTIPERCGKCGASRANLEARGGEVRCLLCGWQDWEPPKRKWTERDPRNTPHYKAIIREMQRFPGRFSVADLTPKTHMSTGWINDVIRTLVETGAVERYAKAGFGRRNLYRWIGGQDNAA